MINSIVIYQKKKKSESLLKTFKFRECLKSPKTLFCKKNYCLFPTRDYRYYKRVLFKLFRLVSSFLLGCPLFCYDFRFSETRKMWTKDKTTRHHIKVSLTSWNTKYVYPSESKWSLNTKCSGNMTDLNILILNGLRL